MAASQAAWSCRARRSRPRGQEGSRRQATQAAWAAAHACRPADSRRAAAPAVARSEVDAAGSGAAVRRTARRCCCCRGGEAAAAAERLRVRLARELATRGHDGPSGFAAVRYTAPSLADASCCVICLEDADDLDGFGLMLCCGNGVCRECLGRSLAQGGKAMKTGYGGCEAKAPPSKCPAGCNASVKSSYRGWACR